MIYQSGRSGKHIYNLMEAKIFHIFEQRVINIILLKVSVKITHYIYIFLFLILKLYPYKHQILHSNLLFQLDVHIYFLSKKVRKRANIRNRYNQAPHLTQDTNGQLDIANESQEVTPFPAGDHKASTNRRA